MYLFLGFSILISILLKKKKKRKAFCFELGKSLDFKAVTEQNRLTLKIKDYENIIGNEAPDFWFGNFGHVSNNLLTEDIKKKLYVMGFLKIRSSFIESDDFGSTIYTTKIPADKLFGLSKISQFDTAVENIKDELYNYQNTEGKIIIFNTTNKPISFRLYTGSITLGLNRQYYLINGQKDYYDFTLAAAPFITKQVALEYTLNKITLPNAIEDPEKYKITIKVIPNCPSVDRLLFKITSTEVDNGMFFDLEHNIHYRVVFEGKEIPLTNGKTAIMNFDVSDGKENEFYLYPVCNKNSKTGKTSISFSWFTIASDYNQNDKTVI